MIQLSIQNIVGYETVVKPEKSITVRNIVEFET